MNPRSGLIFVFSTPTFSVRGLRPTAMSTLSGFDLLLLTFSADGHGNPTLGFFNLFKLRARVERDAALAVDARQFFGDLFIFHRHKTRQHFDDSHSQPKER